MIDGALKETRIIEENLTPEPKSKIQQSMCMATILKRVEQKLISNKSTVTSADGTAKEYIYIYIYMCVCVCVCV